MKRARGATHRSRRPTAQILALAASILALSTIGTAAGAGDTKPPRTWITVRGLTDRATLTSLCGVDEDGNDFCSETNQRLVGRLPVEPRDFVRVRTRPGAGRVKAYLVRLRQNGDIARYFDWSRRAREISGTNGRRWRFRLPSDLGNANAIHLFLRYPDGAAFPGGNTIFQATYTSRISHD